MLLENENKRPGLVAHQSVIDKMANAIESTITSDLPNNVETGELKHGSIQINPNFSWKLATVLLTTAGIIGMRVYPNDVLRHSIFKGASIVGTIGTIEAVVTTAKNLLKNPTPEEEQEFFKDMQK